MKLQAHDDATRLESLGLPLQHGRSPGRTVRFRQPCAAYDGCQCCIYADRPSYCRDFECALFKSVKAGRTSVTKALRAIRGARTRADNVRRLLRGLGDTDEDLSLSLRFRRTSKRLQQYELDKAAGAAYADLTLAVHELNLLLADVFYPGGDGKERKPLSPPRALSVACAVLTVFAAALPLRADQVELGNGDRYIGNLQSVNSSTVVLQSDVLGTVRLPRSKVAVITFGRVAGTNAATLLSPTNAPAAARSASSTNPVANVHPVLRQLGASTNLIRQVQKQFLSGAGDEANAKFNELLTGLMTGTLSVEDIRGQAKSAADQLRALQKETGEEAGFAASAYLSILDHFLKETAPADSKSNRPPPSAKPTAKPAPETE